VLYQLRPLLVVWLLAMLPVVCHEETTAIIVGTLPMDHQQHVSSSTAHEMRGHVHPNGAVQPPVGYASRGTTAAPAVAVHSARPALDSTPAAASSGSVSRVDNGRASGLTAQAGVAVLAALVIPLAVVSSARSRSSAAPPPTSLSVSPLIPPPRLLPI
jgi:hypothetical protein